MDEYIEIRSGCRISGFDGKDLFLLQFRNITYGVGGFHVIL